MAERTSDAGIYFAAVALGLGAGLVDIWVADLLLTALAVLASTMLLGVLRPKHPWRWVMIVAAFVPLAHLGAYLIWKVRPDRAQVYESFLGFLTGSVGAFAGAAMRHAFAAIFAPK